MFKFTLLPEARLLVQFRGFWDIAMAQALHDEMRATLRRAPTPLSILSDTTDLAIQSGPVVEVLSSVAALLARSTVERHAMVMPLALQRMQGRRALGETPYRAFDTVPAAAAWLEWPMPQLEPHLRHFRAAAQALPVVAAL